ncbi:MAG TPA: thioredoxin-disulfide reductase [Bacilli bacterium]|nr:thioredoxin-disulfide reductase [Bacilli bacterium]
MDRKTDVTIVGSGPAGITATIYLKRALIDVVLLDKYVPGGKVNFTAEIENYPGFNKITGPDLAGKFFEQVQNFGVEVTYGDVLDIEKKDDEFKVITDDGTITSKFVIFATGTDERKMNIPGEDEFKGKGVSYCAVCDGSFYKGENVAVVGGGNSALQEALYLSGFVKKVFLIHRRQGFRADELLVKKVKSTGNIELVLDSVTLAVEGEKFVSGIKIKNAITGEEKILPVKAVFPYIGQIPATKGLSKLQVLDEHGYVIVDENMETKVGNLFGAGDVVKKNLRQIVTATNDGAIAAIEITHRSL